MLQSDWYYKSLAEGVTSKVGLLLTEVFQSSSVSPSDSVSVSLSFCRAWETQHLLYFHDIGSHVVRATIQHISLFLTNCDILSSSFFFLKKECSFRDFIASKNIDENTIVDRYLFLMKLFSNIYIYIYIGCTVMNHKVKTEPYQRKSNISKRSHIYL